KARGGGGRGGRARATGDVAASRTVQKGMPKTKSRRVRTRNVRDRAQNRALSAAARTRRKRTSSLPAHPPSEPLVEGTSLAARGSIASAMRNALARPLKQDSAM